MKRFFVTTVLLLTALTVTQIQAFGDLKNFRGGSFNRNNSMSSNSPKISSTIRNHVSDHVANSGHVQNGGGSNSTSGKTFDQRITLPHSKLNLPVFNHGNSTGIGGNHAPGSNGKPPIVLVPGGIHLPNQQSNPHDGKGTIFHGNSGHGSNSINPGQFQIQLGDGKTTKPIGLNVGQLFQNKSGSSHGQSQVQQIVSKAPKNLCAHPHFQWWVSVCHNHCHTNYGCWNIHEQYWNSWTSCNWHVVKCQQLSWYVGMTCIYIPDMQAYGVQSIVDGSPAHRAGLLPGDLILTANGQPIFDPNLVNTEVGRGRLELTIVREGFATPLSTTIIPSLVQTMSY